MVASAWLGRGDTQKAISTAHEAVEILHRSGSFLDEPLVLEVLARTLIARGDSEAFEEAAAALARAAAAARGMGSANDLPRIERARADLAGARGDSAARDAALRAALSGFEAIGAEGHVAAVKRGLG